MADDGKSFSTPNIESPVATINREEGSSRSGSRVVSVGWRLPGNDVPRGRFAAAE